MYRKLNSYHLRPQILEPLRAHRSTVIWLHGLGDTSAGFAELMAHVLAPRLPHTRFVLPNAPMRPISVNNNMEMPGWYDIADVGAARALAAEDREGIEESAAALSALLADEVRQLSQRSKSTSTSTSEAASSGNTADADTDAEASRRVAIGGFSQGGAMALRVGLAWNSPLAALVTASAYVVQRDALLSGEINSTANAATPILAVHGANDPMVPMAYAKETYDAIGDRVIHNLTFEAVPHCAHEFPISTAHRVAQFLHERFSPLDEETPKAAL